MYTVTTGNFLSIIYNILISSLLLIISLIGILIPGIVLAHFIIPQKSKETYFWIFAPFLGISITIIILQSLVYLDIPLSLSAFPFFILFFVIFCYIYQRSRKDIPDFPKNIFLLGFIVIIVQGFGYWLLGAENYIGYGWIDQYNYVAIAQFLIDKPFSTTFMDVQNIPYLVRAIGLKDVRIGVSILQGYFSVLGQSNAKSLYGTISLLSPFLTSLSAYLLSKRFIKNEWAQYGSAIAASCLPGFALVQLQNFLAQSMIIPFLLLWPIVIENLLKQNDIKYVLIGIVIFAGIHSIYTEFTLIFILVSIIGLIGYVIQTGSFKSSIKKISVVLILGFLINFGYVERSIIFINAIVHAPPGILDSIYPFALKIDGLGFLWFGYKAFTLNDDLIIAIILLVSIFFMILSYLGLINLFRKQKDIVSLQLLFLSLFPIVFISMPNPYPYPFFKMLTSISPILVLGLWILLSDSPSYNFKSIFHISIQNTLLKKILLALPKILLIGTLIAFVSITFYLASFSISGGGRSAVTWSNSEKMQNTYNYLENTKNLDFILSEPNPDTLAWLAYHGRQDNIFFINNQIGDVTLDNSNYSFNDPAKFPQSAVKISIGDDYPKITSPNLYQNLIVYINNPEGLDGSEQTGYWNWLGEDFNLIIFSKFQSDINVNISFVAIPSEQNTVRDKINTIQLSMIEGDPQTPIIIHLNNQQTVVATFEIKPGMNIIKFGNLDLEKGDITDPLEKRNFFISISRMTINSDN